MLERIRLDGRVAVIYGGGGGGMGTATTLALAEAGAQVVAVDLTEERAREVQDQVAAAGGRCLGVAADVRDIAAVEGVCTRAVAEFGGIDTVVNLVGGSRLERRTGGTLNATTWTPVAEYDDSLYDDILAVNLHYVFHACRAAARHMIERGRGGTIVNFGSVSALAGAPYHAPYGLAKAAVLSLTQSLAVELGPHGIRANAIVPGSVPAPLAQAASATTFAAISDRASARSPLGRRVATDEIAGAVLFLAGELSAGITGQCLNVDAGVSANSPLGTGHDYAESARLRRESA